MSDTAHVIHNEAARRYEILVDDTVAGFIQYKLADGVLTLVHTEVEPAFGGQGIGSKLARGALDIARTSGHEIVSKCPFLDSWVKKHPEYQEFVRHG